MREFKIRVWDVKANDWYYTVSSKPEDHNVLDTYYFENLYQNEEDYIWEQYTGIKDKNGREIYEGDIVRFEAYSRVFQVVYRQWDCSFMFENDEDEEIVHMFNDFQDKYEIIGNIHENPELLGKEDTHK